MSKTDRLPPGVHRQADGSFRVVASIGRTRRREKRFPKGTTPRAMTTWQGEARTDLRRQPAAAKGSTAADIRDRYLPAVAAMPTLAERERHLELWATQLGPTRARDTVTPPDIRAVLERWRLGGWSPSTCNRRRTALMHFYTVLNGKSGANPVRDVPKYREPRHPPRVIDYATFEAILGAMRDIGGTIPDPDDPKKRTRRAISQTKARLRVIAYTGLPHAQVKALRPEHIDWLGARVYIRGRTKGEGTDDRWLPLSKAGLVALRGLVAAEAFGDFSHHSMHKSFRLAATSVGRPDLRPYDLRHLFGTQVLRSSGNRAATRDLLLHATDHTTRRYVAGAISDELRAAIDAFDRDVVADGGGGDGERADEKPANC